MVYVRLGQLRIYHQRSGSHHTHILRLPLQGGRGRERLLSWVDLHRQLTVGTWHSCLHRGRRVVKSDPGYHRRPRGPEEDPPGSLRGRPARSSPGSRSSLRTPPTRGLGSWGPSSWRTSASRGAWSSTTHSFPTSPLAAFSTTSAVEGSGTATSVGDCCCWSTLC